MFNCISERRSTGEPACGVPRGLREIGEWVFNFSEYVPKKKMKNIEVFKMKNVVSFFKKYFTFRNVWLLLWFLNLFLFALSFAVPALAFWLLLALPLALILEVVRSKYLNPVVDVFLMFSK